MSEKKAKLKIYLKISIDIDNVGFVFAVKLFLSKLLLIKLIHKILFINSFLEKFKYKF